MALKNFGMLVPKYGSTLINDCWLHSGTGKEYELFRKWVGDNLIQLQADKEMLDRWIQKPHELSREIKSIQQWFEAWRNPPKREVIVTTYTIPIKQK